MFAVYDEGTGKYLNIKAEGEFNSRGDIEYPTLEEPTVGSCYHTWKEAARAAEKAYNENDMYDEVVVVEV